MYRIFETDLLWDFSLWVEPSLPEINLWHDLPASMLRIDVTSHGGCFSYHWKQCKLNYSGAESLKEILTCAHGKDLREHLKTIVQE